MKSREGRACVVYASAGAEGWQEALQVLAHEGRRGRRRVLEQDRHQRRIFTSRFHSRRSARRAYLIALYTKPVLCTHRDDAAVTLDLSGPLMLLLFFYFIFIIFI